MADCMHDSLIRLEWTWKFMIYHIFFFLYTFLYLDKQILVLQFPVVFGTVIAQWHSCFVVIGENTIRVFMVMFYGTSHNKDKSSIIHNTWVSNDINRLADLCVYYNIFFIGLECASLTKTNIS